MSYGQCFIPTSCDNKQPSSHAAELRYVRDEGDVFSKLDLAPSESKSRCQSARMERMRRGRSGARMRWTWRQPMRLTRAHRMHRRGAGPAAHRLPWLPLDPGANRVLDCLTVSS
jgi:hypothetical protein